MDNSDLFRSRFAALLQDMQENRIKDKESMWLLASLASDLSGNWEQPNWSSAKASMTADNYNFLLGKFQEQGNLHHAEGRQKHADAVEVLALSLVAMTQRKVAHMREGEILLDSLIDAAVAQYRKNPAKPAS